MRRAEGDDAVVCDPENPARELALNRVLFDLLGAGEAPGVRVADTGEFIPTGTTAAAAAAVSFHPDARYS